MMIKGKRTKRPRPASPLALAISTSTSSDVESGRVPTSSSTTTATDCGGTLGATTTTTEQEDQDMAAHSLILLAQGGTKFQKLTQQQPSKASLVYAYECKTCNRSFPSFQALGGHRASHNKPKALQPPPEKAVAPPSFMLIDHHHDHDQHQDYFQSASTNNKLVNNGAVQEEMMGLSLQIACGYNSSTTLSASNAKPKVHACSICGAEFSSGQALGGHMRRHRPLPSATSSLPAAPPRSQLCLDLNLPADEQEDVQQQATAQSPKFAFASDKTTLVFASSLVDCRY